MVMKRIFIRRAFTCFQMQALLDNTPSLPQPHIILDLLATFYDEQVPEREINRHAARKSALTEAHTRLAADRSEAPDP